ncbi:RNA/RNP complex-1-interacting phosphatase [Musca vetustissima]|uniref:RNA/RNP complex-1-interacting phosphatase n=1 Tax=Musca vetustissima TaxID=27455 RepID=UPI002AB63FEA|nr:RNA/RNP complex-1-interacting phosphatase [Musca vetustissima]
MAPRIPDRWLDYKAVGDRIEGTRFIAFKVPLKPQLTEAENRFDGKMLLEQVPNLGIIIDLTNTNRYYNPKVFEDEGVQHQKLMIPGHVTPPQRLINKFKDYVKEFLQNNPDNDKLIGVHCTHGVNRTGFLICNYMVSEMSVEPNDAIESKLRPHTDIKNALRNINGENNDNDNTEDNNPTTTTLNNPPDDDDDRKSRERTTISPRMRPQQSSERSWRATERRDRSENNNDNRRWRNPNRNSHDRNETNNNSNSNRSWRNSSNRPPSPKMARRAPHHQQHQQQHQHIRRRNKYQQQCYQLANSGNNNFEFRGRSAMTYGNDTDNSSAYRPQAHNQMYNHSNNYNNNTYNQNDRYDRQHHSRETTNINRPYGRDNSGGGGGDERQRSTSAGRSRQSYHTIIHRRQR